MMKTNSKNLFSNKISINNKQDGTSTNQSIFLQNLDISFKNRIQQDSFSQGNNDIISNQITHQDSEFVK